MANKYISDLHLGHKNIIKKCRTQFTCVEEMDKYIICRWNESVDPDDDVWILGDLSYKAPVHIKYYVKQMKGHKHLIIGNHDYKWMKNCKDLNRYFESAEHMTCIKDEGRNLTLCHYPMMEWPQSRFAEYSLAGNIWLIHGHIHNSTGCDAYHYIRERLPCALNAGFDINDHPVTFEQLLKNNNQWYGREM